MKKIIETLSNNLVERFFCNFQLKNVNEILSKYEQSRNFDNKTRVLGINALNEVSKSSIYVAQKSRALGINFLHSSPKIRQRLMQLGLGINEPN